MDLELSKRIGQRITIGHKRFDGRPFFVDGILKSITDTHIYLETRSGTEAFLLAELSKIEFSKRLV